MTQTIFKEFAQYTQPLLFNSGFSRECATYKIDGIFKAAISLRKTRCDGLEKLNLT